MNPKSEPRAQKLNQNAEMKLTRALKYRIEGDHIISLVYLFITSRNTVPTLTYSMPGPDPWATGEIKSTKHGIYVQGRCHSRQQRRKAMATASVVAEQSLPSLQMEVFPR